MQLPQTQVEEGHVWPGLPVQDFLVLLSRSILRYGGDVKGLSPRAAGAVFVACLNTSARSEAAQSKQQIPVGYMLSWSPKQNTI